jgi:hypothetical protein
MLAFVEFTAQRLKIIAQGFSPGSIVPRRRPESGVRRASGIGKLIRLGPMLTQPVESKTLTLGHTCRAPLSGRVSRRPYPGLKT